MHIRSNVAPRIDCGALLLLRVIALRSISMEQPNRNASEITIAASRLVA
jgi:hypothetical protein